MADILDFPSRAKPRVTEEEFLFGGEGSPSNVTPYADTLEEFKPISSLPRATFGLRPATGEALFNARAEDKAQQEAFKSERVTRAAERAALGDRKHIDPELDRDYAACANQLARTALSMVQDAKTLGHLADIPKWLKIASDAETIAALALAPHLPEGA